MNDPERAVKHMKQVLDMTFEAIERNSCFYCGGEKTIPFIDTFEPLSYHLMQCPKCNNAISPPPSALETVTNLQESLGEPKTDGRDQEVLLNNGEKFPNYNEDKVDR